MAPDNYLTQWYCFAGYGLQFAVCFCFFIWFFIFHPADDDAKSEFSFFPTCQVRVFRFYQSWPAASASTASARAQWALPDLNRAPDVSGTAGPQRRAPDAR